ncbi:uncharacterized protein LOC143177071 [Calliopsis andreniformis]|uniref:uncharacterized protein LOC143177071 n=1 Tax=Calliopsis andreniformis TaxID=337506 RepID=UPI003FCC7ECB
MQRLESTKSMVVEAIVDTLRQRVFDKVTSRKDIPQEYGTQEEMVATSTKLQLAFKEHLRVSRISQEAFLEPGKVVHEEFEEEGSEEGEELSPTSEYLPRESEAKSEIEYTEEQLTEAETDEQRASEAEITSEHLPTSPEPQSEPETEYPEELEAEEDAEGQEATEVEGWKQEEEIEEQEEEIEEQEEPNVAQETGTAGDAVE